MFLIGLMAGLYAAEVYKIIQPSDFIKLKPQLKIPVDKVSCEHNVCKFAFAGHVFDEGADFSWLDLTGADFSQATLKKANFTGAKLTNANFSNAKLDGAVFKTDVTGADFGGSNADLNGSSGTPKSFPNPPIMNPAIGSRVIQTQTATGMPVPTATQVSAEPKTVPPAAPKPVTPPTPPAGQQPQQNK